MSTSHKKKTIGKQASEININLSILSEAQDVDAVLTSLDFILGRINVLKLKPSSLQALTLTEYKCENIAQLTLNVYDIALKKIIDLYAHNTTQANTKKYVVQHLKLVMKTFDIQRLEGHEHHGSLCASFIIFCLQQEKPSYNSFLKAQTIYACIENMESDSENLKFKTLPNDMLHLCSKLAKNKYLAPQHKEKIAKYALQVFHGAKQQHTVDLTTYQRLLCTLLHTEYAGTETIIDIMLEFKEIFLALPANERNQSNNLESSLKKLVDLMNESKLIDNTLKIQQEKLDALKSEAAQNKTAPEQYNKIREELKKALQEYKQTQERSHFIIHAMKNGSNKFQMEMQEGEQQPRADFPRDILFSCYTFTAMFLLQQLKPAPGKIYTDLTPQTWKKISQLLGIAIATKLINQAFVRIAPLLIVKALIKKYINADEAITLSSQIFALPCGVEKNERSFSLQTPYLFFLIYEALERKDERISLDYFNETLGYCLFSEDYSDFHEQLQYSHETLDLNFNHFSHLLSESQAFLQAIKNYSLHYILGGNSKIDDLKELYRILHEINDRLMSDLISVQPDPRAIVESKANELLRNMGQMVRETYQLTELKDFNALMNKIIAKYNAFATDLLPKGEKREERDDHIDDENIILNPVEAVILDGFSLEKPLEEQALEEDESDFQSWISVQKKPSKKHPSSIQRREPASVSDAHLPIEITNEVWKALKANNHQIALDIIENNPDLQQEDPHFFYAKLVCLRRMKEYQQILTTLIDHDNLLKPSFVFFHRIMDLKAQCLRKTGQISEALNAYDTIKNPSLSQMLAIAHCHKEAGNIVKAIESYECIIRQKREMTHMFIENIYLNLAACYSKQDDFNQAFETLRKAHNKVPHSISINEQYLRTLIQLSPHTHTKFLKTFKSLSAWTALLAIEYKNKWGVLSNQDSGHALEALKAQNPEFKLLYLKRVQFYLRFHNKEKAEAIRREFIQRFPDEYQLRKLIHRQFTLHARNQPIEWTRDLSTIHINTISPGSNAITGITPFIKRESEPSTNTKPVLPKPWVDKSLYSPNYIYELCHLHPDSFWGRRGNPRIPESGLEKCDDDFYSAGKNLVKMQRFLDALGIDHPAFQKPGLEEQRNSQPT